MDIFDSELNRRINTGCFPVQTIYTSSPKEVCFVDIEEKAIEGLHILQGNPEFTAILFSAFKRNVDCLEQIDAVEYYRQDINILLNTKVSMDSIDPFSEMCIKAQEKPVVTKLDKILWMGAYMYFQECSYCVGKEELENLGFAWSFLMLTTEEKELRHKITLSESSLEREDIMEIILSEWDNSGECFAKITDEEYVELERLSNLRTILGKQLQGNLETSYKIAEETKSEWGVFINLINDMSQREKSLIEEIVRETTKREKISAISEYDSVIKNIDYGKYELLDGTEVELLPLFDAISERFTGAINYCTVDTGEYSNIRVTPAILALAVNPKTYNYLLIKFHQFRIRRDKQTAKEFLSLSLDAIHKNLNITQPKKNMPAEDMIFDFYQCVTLFVDDNKADLQELKFNAVQENVISLGQITSESINLETSNRALSAMLRDAQELLDEIDDEGGLVDLIDNNNKLTQEEILSEIQDFEVQQKKMDAQNFARSIVFSLDIIYMFCEVLRMILSNGNKIVKLKDTDKVKQYRKELLAIDSWLGQKVYSELDIKDPSLLETREESGVVANSLEEKETYAETLRNGTFAEIFKNNITELINDIGSLDIESLCAKKKEIKLEIQRFPDCSEKEYYATWIDEISEMICTQLIGACKSDKDDYLKQKQMVMATIGGSAKLLPDDAIDSLTTAEMLYSRYAKEPYCSNGFDYSSISALYYQSFEAAYNKLIWSEYANRLNNLNIDDVPFTKIMEENRNRYLKNGVPGKGYLDARPDYRKYYIEYPSKNNNSNTYVKSNCMYKSFGILMENIVEKSWLDKYCDYFSEITGFNNSLAMVGDKSFLDMCGTFAKVIVESAEKRNKASHGGVIINKDQCTNDKNTILNDLKANREDNIGLIWQLLQILTYKNGN